MYETLSLRLRWLLFITGALVIIACIYILVSTVITINSTGTLRVDASPSQAVISVSQPNRAAKIVGISKAGVRLKPGVYLVMASNGIGNGVATTSVNISKGQMTTISLKPSKEPRIRSVDNVTFRGQSGFSDSGLSEEQLNALRLNFFRYKPSAHTVTIHSDSIEPGPHNPSDTFFTTRFGVTIDSTIYNAVITYSGLEDINLSLHSPQDGSLLFDSAATSSEKSD